MCIGTSGKDEDKTWLAGCFTHPESLQGTKHADNHAMFKSLSLGREHYRRQANTVRRYRHYQQKRSNSMHMSFLKIALQKSFHKNVSRTSSGVNKINQINLKLIDKQREI